MLILFHSGLKMHSLLGVDTLPVLFPVTFLAPSKYLVIRICRKNKLHSISVIVTSVF